MPDIPSALVGFATRLDLEARLAPFAHTAGGAGAMFQRSIWTTCPGFRFSWVYPVSRSTETDFTVHFTECNGRWGGTSTPMHLVDRVVLGPRPPYRAQEVVSPKLVGESFEDLAAALGDRLFDHRTRHGRYLLYNVGPLQRFGKLAVIALGSTQAEADEALQYDLPVRLGID